MTDVGVHRGMVDFAYVIKHTWSTMSIRTLTGSCS